MINNFIKFEHLLNFENSGDDFYFLQIMSRRKDNPNQEKGTKIIKESFIDNLEYYQRKQEDWIRLAHEFNARVTIRVNRRSYRKCAFKTLGDIANKIELGQFRACQSSFQSMAGKYRAKGSKYWIVDIDDCKDKQLISSLFDHPTLPFSGKLISILESKSGYHLISKPFDYSDWKNHKSNLNNIKIEIIKDGCTNLYIP